MKLSRRFLRRFHENLELGTLLAFVAGVVNTVGFLQFGAFVSHMSGHATRTAVEYAEGNTSAALVYMLELLAFIGGAFITAFLLHGHSAAEKRVKYTKPIILEALCILLFLSLNKLHGLLWFSVDHISLTTLILSLSMGLQNAMLRHASGTIIRTTHMTGVATDIGIELGSAFHAARATWREVKDAKATVHAFGQRLGVGRFMFHCLLLTAFFVGALVGTIGYIYLTANVLLVPLTVLIALSIKEFRRKVAISY